jgi:hypothetical protein
LSWKSSHGYLLADKYEQINYNKSKHDVFYGWVRGNQLELNHQSQHLPGIADFNIKNISIINDPISCLKKLDKGSGKGRILKDNDKYL